MLNLIKSFTAAGLILFSLSGCMQNPLSSFSSSQKDMEEIEASMSDMLTQLQTAEKLLVKVKQLLILLDTQKKEQEKLLRIVEEQEKWVTLSGTYNTNVYHQMRFMRQSFVRQGKLIKGITTTSASLKKSLSDSGNLNKELKTQIQKAIELSP